MTNVTSIPKRLCLFFWSLMIPSAMALGGPLFDPPDEAIPWTVDVGSTKQLFLDDRLIVQAQNVGIYMAKPEKYVGNPVVIADRPWEQNVEGEKYHGVQMGMQACLYDKEDQCFKMWYYAINRDRFIKQTGKEMSPWCYATSKDGYHWGKPELGIVECDGSTANNIVGLFPEESYTAVIKTSSDPDPQRRYKAFGELEPKGQGEKHGACVAFSPDGIHWTRYEGNPVIKKGPDFADGSNIMGWDPRIQKYVAYLRTGRPSSRPQGSHLTRSVGYAESDDFIHWSPMKLMLAPNEKDPPGMEYELFSGAYDPNTTFYIGLVHYLQFGNKSIYLMSSRDGFRWTWIDRKVPFIPLGPAGSYDQGRILPAGPILHDGKMWIFYSAMGAWYNPVKKKPLGGSNIALATCPIDRYVGLQAGGAFTGRVVTRALVFEGDRLFIDISDFHKTYSDSKADTIPMRVGLLNYRGEPIPGFTLEDCQPFTQGGFQQVHWSGGSLNSIPVEDEWYTKEIHDWPGIKRRIQIVFEYKNTVLYSFQFQP